MTGVGGGQAPKERLIKGGLSELPVFGIRLEYNPSSCRLERRAGASRSTATRILCLHYNPHRAWRRRHCSGEAAGVSSG